jgi:hypothetical protein
MGPYQVGALKFTISRGTDHFYDTEAVLSRGIGELVADTSGERGTQAGCRAASGRDLGVAVVIGVPSAGRTITEMNLGHRGVSAILFTEALVTQRLTESRWKPAVTLQRFRAGNG